MPGRGSHRQDPFQRINSWDDGYEYIQGQMPYPSDGRNPPPYYSPPPMSGARHPPPEPNVPRRHTDNYRPRRRDPSPLSDYDVPRRRHHRDDSPPPYRSVESHSPPPRRSRYEEEALPRRKSTRNAPTPRSYGRSPSPPPRRSERDDRHRHHEPRYRSPSPDRGRRRRSADRHHTARPASPARHRAPPTAAKPGLSRSKTTTGIGLSPRWQQAAAAALQAGSMAALSMRSEPGAWNGAKGAKVVTAALGAGVMRAAAKGEPEGARRSSGGGGASRGPGSGSGSGGMKNKGAEMLGNALSGFVAQQFAKRAQKGAARY